MIKLEKTKIYGLEEAIRGMRNPLNSWDKSDSKLVTSTLVEEEVCPGINALVSHPCEPYVSIGPNDHELMMKLAKGGPTHAKYRRMIAVYVDITAPLYWWKEFDTYKVGTVANSCSTMHKIHAKEFTLDDFSHDQLLGYFETKEGACHPIDILKDTIIALNTCRDAYLEAKSGRTQVDAVNARDFWYNMIQLLPSSYNQKRTIMFNYEVLAGIYPTRKNHKLDEWHILCDWIKSLPYSEIIIGEQEGTDDDTQSAHS